MWNGLVVNLRLWKEELFLISASESIVGSLVEHQTLEANLKALLIVTAFVWFALESMEDNVTVSN